jgi:hypothetical protein
MHLKRLASYGSAPARQALPADGTGNPGSDPAPRLGYSDLERIDRITDLYDRIAFDFCFEAPAGGEVRIYPRKGSSQQPSWLFVRTLPTISSRIDGRGGVS